MDQEQLHILNQYWIINNKIYYYSQMHELDKDYQICERAREIAKQFTRRK